MNYDRIILELLDRVSSLEEQVNQLRLNIQNKEEKSDDDTYTINSTTGKDTTKYLFDGRKYGKNRLVLAIVKRYMRENPDTSKEQLMEVFDKSLQGSLGVIRELNEVKNSYSDYERRFFVASNDIIDTETGICVVCNQWGVSNIGNMIARAKKLGMEITVLKYA